MRTLFSGEKIIVEAENKKVVLTNKRIWKEDISGGKSFYQSIMLPHISSIQCLAEEYFVLLLVAAILFLYTIYDIFINNSSSNGNAQGIVAGVAGAIFLILYFITKGSTVIIASSSAKIKLSIKGMKKDKVLNFIDQVEKEISEHKNYPQ